MKKGELLPPKEVKTVCDMFIDNIDDIIKSMADSSYNDYVETL